MSTYQPSDTRVTDFFKRTDREHEDNGKAGFPPSPLRTRAERVEQIRMANRVVFKNNSFRSQQEAIILAALDNQDVYVNMPTGGGKSLCYMVRGMEALKPNSICTRPRNLFSRHVPLRLAVHSSRRS